jgi:thymidylate synthase
MWRKFPFWKTDWDETTLHPVTKKPCGDSQLAFIGSTVDQLQNILNKLKTNPDDRRLIVSAWHPYWVDHCALPPCHCLFQFHTEELTEHERLDLWQQKVCPMVLEDGTKIVTSGLPTMDMVNFSKLAKERFDKDGIPSRRLNLQLYQRSADLGLGASFNWASYSLLLQMVAQVVNMIPGEFIWTAGDLHIYQIILRPLKNK